MTNLKNELGRSIAFAGAGRVWPSKKATIGCFLFCCILQGCGPSVESKQELETQSGLGVLLADSVSSGTMGISTDTINGVTHNFVRKAEMKFKVKDVLHAAKQIEDIVEFAGGYISSSKLSSGTQYSNSIRVTKDSLLEQIYYSTNNQISLRVPNRLLDMVLRQISDLALFIDYRTLTSDDVKMKLFSNKLAERRYQRFRNEVSKKAGNIAARQRQIIFTEESLLQKQAEADQKRMASLELADQVNYSTVWIEVYQAPACTKVYVAAEELPEPYQPSFLQKAGAAFLNGFVILKTLILFLINSWGVLCIVLLLYFAVRKGATIGRKNREHV